MISRRKFIKQSVLGVSALTISPAWANNSVKAASKTQKYVTNRPPIANRKFVSKAVEATIERVKPKIKDAKLAWMFENCFPNTLDTTVNFTIKNGRPDTFVITGDIDAMWLRDSSAQVWTYLPLMNDDESLKQMIAGLINRQTECILIDPYANAFNPEPMPDGRWMSDFGGMKSELHERKWEIDSLCYPIRLAHRYWKTTGDTSVFDSKWREAMALVVKTFKDQQRKDGKGSYRFLRVTDRQLDTLNNIGYGNPVNPVGLIVSSFRPSDDATTFGFLVPSNMFAVTSLRQLVEISKKVTLDLSFANECKLLADEVDAAIQKYCITTHANHGQIYAYEVDGFGNYYLMDDANVPSLLAIPYLGSENDNNEIYRNTRNFVLSNDNPYFFKGSAGEGIGGPHVGYDMVWHMSIIMRAMTSKNDDEIKYCLRMLRDTDADTGFMHESFHKDNPEQFTRGWFAWTNTLFGELILKLEKENKLNLSDL